MSNVPWSVAGDIGGTVISGLFGSSEARKNRAFQERMAKNAHQYAAQDLEKAGLNRILALGSPAATPAGATASIGAPALGQTGIAAASAKQQIKLNKALEEAAGEQAWKNHADGRLAHATADKQETIGAIYKELKPIATALAKGANSVGKFSLGGWTNLIKMFGDK